MDYDPEMEMNDFDDDGWNNVTNITYDDAVIKW